MYAIFKDGGRQYRAEKGATLELDQQGPKEGEKLPEVGGLFKGGMNLLMCDGSVRWMRRDIDPVILRALITPSGGEVITGDDADKGSTQKAK